LADNHKPEDTTIGGTSIILPSSLDPDTLELSVPDKDGNEALLYTGSQISKQSSGKYVLLYDETKTHYVLDKVDSEFNFNFTAGPNGTLKGAARKYRQLDSTGEITAPEATGSDEDVLGEGEEDAEEGNPYDFRHFLKKIESSSSESEPPTMPQKIVRPTNPKPATKTAQAPDKPKRKYTKKAKPEQAPVVRKRSPSPPKEVERNYLSADDEDSDEDAPGEPDSEAEVAAGEESSDDDLIIEEGDAPKKRRYAAARSPGGLTAGGPISLRSAANSASPGSIASPRGLGIRNAVMSESEESDADDDDVHRGGYRNNPDSDVDRDEDGLNLPSPAVGTFPHSARLGDSAPTPTGDIDMDDADFEGDMEADLEKAFEDEFEVDNEMEDSYLTTNGVLVNGANRRVEESDESEED
jgi:RNA polymerase II transcription elongation factor